MYKVIHLFFFKQEFRKNNERKEIPQKEYIIDNDLQNDDENYYEEKYSKNVMNTILDNMKEPTTQPEHEIEEIQKKLDNVKQYEDKSQQIQELDMLTEEQGNNQIQKNCQDKIIKLQRAKIESLQNQIESAASKVQMKETLIQEMQSKGKNIADQSKKYFAQINQINERIDQTKQKTQDTINKRKAFEKENVLLSKELDIVKKEFRKIDAEINKKDIRINRTQEEISKFKLNQQQSKLQQKEKYGDLNEQCDVVRKENQKIEGQVLELLGSVRKQLQLADILKRQRVHLIAAKVFQYVEEDFMQTIDLGQRAKKNL